MPIKNRIRTTLKTAELDTLFGACKDFKNIGEGGNSLVFSAMLGEMPVAVKFLSEDVDSKLTRFKLEYLNLMTI